MYSHIKLMIVVINKRIDIIIKKALLKAEILQKKGIF